MNPAYSRDHDVETTSGQTTPRAKSIHHDDTSIYTQNTDLSTSNPEEQSTSDTVLSVFYDLVTEFTRRIEEAHSKSMEVDWIRVLHHTGNARSNKGPITSEECREFWYSAGETIKESSELDRIDHNGSVIVENGVKPDTDITYSNEEACQAALAHLKMFEWIERRAESNLPGVGINRGKENDTRMT
ncbi:hypothetical protein V866_002894 [Kwoniella sp. B9012]